LLPENLREGLTTDFKGMSNSYDRCIAIKHDPYDFFVISGHTAFPHKQIDMSTDKRLGFVGIILEDREHTAHRVNDILSDHANIILARTGIPHIKGGNSVITLVIDSSTDELGKLTGRLGAVPGVLVKSALSKK